MRELAAVDAPSRARVEEFLSGAIGERVSLGDVRLAAGPVGWVIAGISRASAVTIGRTIFLSRRMSSADGETALDRLGSLLVHECVHVWQYGRLGKFVFLSNYVNMYLRELKATGSMRREARRTAYFGIAFEAEAYRVEALWREHEALNRVGGSNVGADVAGSTS